MGEKSKAIQVNDGGEHIVDITMETMKSEMNRWDRRFIYKLPACVTNLNQNDYKPQVAYKPQVVSFGPYHYGDENLKPMEEHKQRALLHFLRRSRKPLESYVNSLAEILQDLKDAYDALPPKWHENAGEFLQLMVRDGCFMLDILRTSIQSMRDYARNDPIFSDHGRLYIMPYIKRDLLMIENQLPILVLQKLLKVENEDAQEDTDYISWLIFQFYHPDTIIKPQGKCLHVLDVFRKSLLQEPPTHKEKSPKKLLDMASGDEIIRSATELNEAGIKITNSDTKSLKDIRFDDCGILRLPPIVVDDVTETMFLNLIAFERFHVGAGNEVTAYIFFMDSIINDSEDVKLLHSGGIIQNALGSDKAVADLFNSLSRDVTLDPENSLSIVHNRVTNYCKNPWPRWRANLNQTYFTNPWASISFVAAIFLFALTITQTVYSISDYYKS